jgi:uncharacterized protein YjeT (DUF2065 family)
VRKRRSSSVAATGKGNGVPDSLWAAFALVLVVEGLLPLLAPRLWRDSFAKLIAMSDGQLRFIGLASIIAGLLAFWLVRHA